jgi:hypothetical protein
MEVGSYDHRPILWEPDLLISKILKFNTCIWIIWI